MEQLPCHRVHSPSTHKKKEPRRKVIGTSFIIQNIDHKTFVQIDMSTCTEILKCAVDVPSVCVVSIKIRKIDSEIFLTNFTSLFI